MNSGFDSGITEAVILVRPLVILQLDDYVDRNPKKSIEEHSIDVFKSNYFLLGLIQLPPALVILSLKGLFVEKCLFQLLASFICCDSCKTYCFP